MFGPNITQHYHAFGRDTNNAGHFLAINPARDFTLVTGGYHKWNGKGDGGAFFNDQTTAKTCNLITSQAVDSRTDTTFKPNSMAQLPLIKT